MLHWGTAMTASKELQGKALALVSVRSVTALARAA